MYKLWSIPAVLLSLSLAACFGGGDSAQTKKDRAECQQYVGQVFDSVDECVTLMREHRQREKDLLKEIQQQKEVGRVAPLSL